MKKHLFLAIFFMSFIPVVSAADLSWALEGVLTLKWVDGVRNTKGGFHNGVAVVQNLESEDNKELYGAIDKTGRLVIPCQYAELSDFCNGTAYAKGTDGKYGIIDTIGAVVLPFNYDEIKRIDEHPEVYIVKDSYEKFAFYGRDFLNKESANTIDANYFPVVRCDGDFFNVKSGNVVKDAQEVFDVLVSGDKYYDMSANPIDIKEGKISSKGIMWFQNDSTKLYGFKKCHNNVVVCEPFFESLKIKVWSHDVMVATKIENDSTKYYLVHSDGTYLKIPGNPLYVTDDCVIYTQGDFFGMCDHRGEVIIIPEYQYILPDYDLGKDIITYHKEGDNGYYNTKVKKHLKGYFASEDVRDGIGILYADGKYRYINMAKFKQIGKIYDSAEPFSEGLARVDESKFINKKGKVVADFKEFADVGKEFSENVIAVEYKDKHYHTKYGYVFSPLITWDCAYNQKSATKAVLNEWCNQADKYFKYEWYSTAEYVYRKVLNVEPDNQAVWVNYGVCLYHRGEKQQSLDAFSKAIELDPDDENAVNNYNIVKKQLEQKQQYAEEQNTQSGNGDGVYNALMNFANALTNAFGGQKSYSSGGYNGGYSSSYNSSSSYDTNSGGTNTSGASESTYRSMYSRWENEAKSLYESLTSRGSSSTSKSGEKSGTSNGYWKNKTSGLKSNLRNAQKQMRHIRSEALSKGIRIEQSKWETATVN